MRNIEIIDQELRLIAAIRAKCEGQPPSMAVADQLLDERLLLIQSPAAPTKQLPCLRMPHGEGALMTTPGWYPDPNDPQYEGFWDGAQWRDRRYRSTPASRPNGSRKTWIVLTITAATLIVAAVVGVLVFGSETHASPKFDACMSRNRPAGEAPGTPNFPLENLCHLTTDDWR